MIKHISITVSEFPQCMSFVSFPRPYIRAITVSSSPFNVFGSWCPLHDTATISDNASLRGATVIAADIDDGKLRTAVQMGAAYGLNTMAPDFRERLAQVTGGDGPDVVVEAVGSPATYRLAVDSVAFTGRVVCIGYSKQDVTFETRLFVQKELDIRGSRNAEPSDFRAVIRYMERGTCPDYTLVSSITDWTGAQEELSKWSKNPGNIFRILLKTF